MSSFSLVQPIVQTTHGLLEGFTEAGIPARAVSGGTPQAYRTQNRLSADCAGDHPFR